MTQTPDQPDAGPQDLVALLAWYQAAGVDSAVSDTPVAWLGEPGRVPGGDFAWPEQATGPVRPSSTTHQGPDRSNANLRTDGSTQKGAPQSTWTPSQFPARAPPASAGGASQLSGRTAETVRTPPARFASGAPEAAETAARALAAQAADIAALEAALKTFDGCALKATAKSTCVYRGAASATVMIIGEAPGRDEDLEGRPFVGRAGQLLDRMLAAIDLDESAVHITNVVYWRPPGNRTPTPQETQICRPFLERQAELVKPQLILLLGGAAAKSILDTADGIMRLRGKWRDVTLGQVTARALATLHPAYLLRTPAAKRMVWRDLLALKAALSKKTDP